MNKIVSHLIYQNAHIDIVHDACKLCYKSKHETELEKKLKYIEDKVKLGHESVIAHSNVIVMVIDPNNDTMEEYAEVLTAGNFLRSVFERDENGNVYYLFGGNIRAYKGLYRNIKNDDNIIAKKIMEALYRTPKEYYYDFITAGIMEERSFIDSEVLYDTLKLNSLEVINNGDKVQIINIDDIEQIMYEIEQVTYTPFKLFDYDDILDLCSITVFFKDMSRIITQMATRHFAGISQQSQRYVDESKAIVNNPLKFTDYLPINKEFDIPGMGKMTLDELGEKLTSIYSHLRQQGLKKEDARFYLPQGVKSSLYMTFTIRNLIHFLSVRLEESAQHEIRLISESILNPLEEYLKPVIGEDIFKYLIPKYSLRDIDYNYDEIDECMEIIEEE